MSSGPRHTAVAKSPPGLNTRAAENLKLDPEAAKALDERLRQTTGFRLDELTSRPYGHGVTIPTLMAQLRRDFLIHGERDGQEIFDALASARKELLWIEESNQRFYAYNHFGQHPERLVGWFDEHMGPGARRPGPSKPRPMSAPSGMPH